MPLGGEASVAGEASVGEGSVAGGGFLVSTLLLGGFLSGTIGGEGSVAFLVSTLLLGAGGSFLVSTLLLGAFGVTTLLVGCFIFFAGEKPNVALIAIVSSLVGGFFLFALIGSHFNCSEALWTR